MSFYEALILNNSVQSDVLDTSGRSINKSQLAICKFVDYVEDVLTPHQKAVECVVQDNMRKYLLRSGGIGEQTDFYSTDERIITHIFPAQFRHMVTRQIVGIHPALGPTNLLCVSCSESEVSDTSVIESQYLKSKFYGLDCPTGPVKLVVYVSRTMNLGSPLNFAKIIDDFVVRNLHYVAKPDTWNCVERFAGGFVVAHPDDEHMVTLRTGHPPILTERLQPGEVLIGKKHNEYFAPLYFCPYIPIVKCRDDAGTPAYKTRFGLVGGDLGFGGANNVEAGSSNLVSRVVL